jgi:hypothetical protein
MLPIRKARPLATARFPGMSSFDGDDTKENNGGRAVTQHLPPAKVDARRYLDAIEEGAPCR